MSAGSQVDEAVQAIMSAVDDACAKPMPTSIYIEVMEEVRAELGSRIRAAQAEL